MTRTFFILTIFMQTCLQTLCFSQKDNKPVSKKNNDTTVTTQYIFTNSLSEFPGGKDSLNEFLKRNLKWPSPDWCGQGTVYVGFTVDTTGSIKNINIIHGLCDKCNMEASRVVSLMPKWTPSVDDKKNKVPISMTLPIKFRME